MSRHHPYGGYEGQARRGGPPGPGPDRFRHERGRGRGGGPGAGFPRGGGRSSMAPYSPSSSNQSSAPYSNGYASGGYNDAPVPAQGSYGADPYYSEYAPDSSNGGGGGYDEHPGGHGQYEGGPSVRGGGGGGGGAGGGGGNRSRRPRERDDQVHDSLIEDRVSRERPCRTLFIRNIKYETSSDDVRRRFEEFGEIKSFYDLVGSRGMVFVTYFDLRAAERARERLQGAEIAGRPIDVHYSLPRADEQSGRCDRDKNQGTLHLVLRNSGSGMPLDDNEVRRKFQQFGDVKSVRPGNGPLERYVEMYDTRGCEDAHDKLQHQQLQDGDIGLDFAWDTPEMPVPTNGGSDTRHRSDEGRRGGDDFGRGGGGGGRGRGHPTRGGGGRGGRGGGGGRDDYGYDDWDRGASEDYNRGAPPPTQMYNGPPPAAVNPAFRPAPAHAPPADDTLQQAKKVQQLLAALKGPGPTSTPPMQPAIPPGAGAPYYSAPPPVLPLQAPPQVAPYGAYGQPPPPAPYAYQPGPPMPVPPQSAIAPLAAPANISTNLMALLHSQPQSATPPPPMGGYNPAGFPSPSSAASAVGTTANAAALQNIMALLQKRT
ncbi:hypothetical protein BKA62DRAFT_438382 [Auriculariales sp. MPI-PUGE-AT-0066]|nr:hypothetical protein BKA62DRAFT_438382 [Auriculariales sp. MPI-PUGE-AT-0066]